MCPWCYGFQAELELFLYIDDKIRIHSLTLGFCTADKLQKSFNQIIGNEKSNTGQLIGYLYRYLFAFLLLEFAFILVNKQDNFIYGYVLKRSCSLDSPSP
jgi:hypothetical protein